MPYAKSLALKGFYSETNAILLASRNASYKKSGIPNPALDMILQAAIFKTSAYLEEYIKNCINDWLHTAIQRNCISSSLPDELRWYCITKEHLGAYKSFINNSDESRLLSAIKSKPINKLLDDNCPIKNLINPLGVVGDRKYPSIRNLKRLFTRIGISNIFDRVNRKTKKNYIPLVQSFLDIRQAIAHQGPPNLTYIDVKNYIKNIQGFVSAIDRILFSHVSNCHGMHCWRTH